ncbi:MAG TPA: c-type cytochrome domain-containing protein [Polyangiaceae bacterium]
MLHRLLLGGLLLTLVSSCGDDSEEPAAPPRCIEPPSVECDPAYPPRFERIFSETLERGCSQTNSCHSADGRQGGLSFTDLDESYALLLGEVDGKARVIANDAACSELIVRTHGVGKAWQMPPGSALRSGELCALRQWIQNGAEPPPDPEPQ